MDCFRVAYSKLTTSTSTSGLRVIQEKSAARRHRHRLANTNTTQRTPPAARICFSSSVQWMTTRRLLPCVPRRNIMNRPSRVTS